VDAKRIAVVVFVALGALALAYNVLVKDEETFAAESEVRLLFIVVFAIGGAYELWKRVRRR
jgi:hypothetical protein